METYKELIRFLKESSENKTLKFHTARTRITAIKRIFKGSSFENSNILDVEIDDVISEFSENNDDISLDTINTYKSRFISALKDYIRYEVLGEEMPSIGEDRVNTYRRNKADDKSKVEVIDLPCPIRKNGHIVTIKNLPVDLTQDELMRLTALIKDFVELDK